MTEKEISRMTNIELSNDLIKASDYMVDALEQFNASQEGKDNAMFYVYLMREASRRLKIPPHITFNDESFDM